MMKPTKLPMPEGIPSTGAKPEIKGVKPHLRMQKIHLAGKSAFGGMGGGAAPGAFDPTNAMPGAPGGAAFPGAANAMGAAPGDAGE